jgi:adenosylcobinamide-phosphate guanylyltransferase
MIVTALVMAGGKGTRMAVREEKPLLKVNSKPLIKNVIEALKDSKKVDSIVVAVSSYTPKTKKYVSNFHVRTIDTPGEGFVPDMDYAIGKLELQTVLAISADLPMITGEVIDAILDHFAICGKPALTVAVSKGVKAKLGLGEEYEFKSENSFLIPAGINVLEGKEIDQG